MNFATSIARTRENVRKSQQTYGEKEWTSDRIKKPWIWYLLFERRFDEQFRDQRILVERGHVVWGSIIQANELLFERQGGHDMLPAAVMYSMETFYDDNPEILVDQAHSLFDLKGRQNCTPQMQAFADKLADEIVADIKLPIPPDFSNGLQCFYATLLIPRRHLPQNHLASVFMPLLVKPDETDATMVLPRRHWDEEFKVALRS